MRLTKRDTPVYRFTLPSRPVRRLALLIPAIGSTGVAAWLMSQIIAANGLGIVGCASLVLFTLNFGWLATHFWSAVLGFIVHMVGGNPLVSTTTSGKPLTARIAVVMPIYNEDLCRVSAGLRTAVAGLVETGEAAHFDFFALSDTPDAEAGAAEQAMIERLRRQHPGGPPIYYRRREKNVGRKAGNIEDFICRWGAAYPYMIVLDADSVMAGDMLVALARLMEAHPDAGIIQTAPVPTNRETAFARILQFASRLYGPIQCSGLAFWAGSDSIYYGHNAIIRTAAFAKFCGLPVLPGKPPLGGEILSHDFVEGALICSGGYKVWFVPELAGSYEEMPANIVGYAKRDRRWCQGNMQHARLLGLPALTAMGRLHLGMGVFSYLTSPLWLALLILSTIDAAQRALVGPEYFKPGFNLFPNWPIATDFQIHLLLGMTLAALFLPKLMGLALVLLDRDRRREFGGAWKLSASVAVEIVFSALLAPVMMVFQTLFVSATFLGRNVLWEAQARDDRGLTWRDASRRLAGHTLIGFGWALGVYAVAPDFFWWLAPIWLGLTLAIPLAAWSSQRKVGLALKRLGLFLTPEEVQPPPELRRLHQALLRPLTTEASRPIIPAESLVPAGAGVAMPRLRWPRGKPPKARDIEFGMTPPAPSTTAAAAHDRSL
jgi:membrane glycosyltransferase